MHKNNSNDLLSHLGNHRRRKDVLQQLAISGLSIDNVPSPAAVGTAGLLGQLLSGPGGDVGQQVADLSKQLLELRTVQQTHIDKVNENTQALAQNTLAKASGSGGSTGSHIASSLLSSVFGLSPIFKGIFDLFSGSKSQPVAPLVPFLLPPSIQYAGGAQQGAIGITAVDYGQGGQIRTLGGQGGSVAAQPANIQVNVTAMDSRSFLDHSEDIARAVRQAMLQSSSLNDVIADL